ncbi:MAG: hypothetical protein P8L44_00315 [Opitutales bacterium]|nr:hypothetical protein [Opitutales bacterium]
MAFFFVDSVGEMDFLLSSFMSSMEEENMLRFKGRQSASRADFD